MIIAYFLKNFTALEKSKPSTCIELTFKKTYNFHSISRQIRKITTHRENVVNLTEL